MNYLAYMFLTNLPHVETEVRYIDGVEQECLIIPTKKNQLKKGRNGNWLMTMRLSEEPPNASQVTHTMQLGYLNWGEVDKARSMGYYERTQHLGRVRVHDRTPSKKIDRNNRATDIICDGVLILSDINLAWTTRNEVDGKRYLGGLRFKPYRDNGVIYTGTMCIDDIPHNYILTDPNTGKKYVKTRFCKMEALDQYMNTHHLVIESTSGSEIEIGRFKEWVREGAVPQPPPQVPNSSMPPRQSPKSIDGIKF